MTLYMFLDLPDNPAEDADVLLLPLPFEGTVSYGAGTADGPAAIVPLDSVKTAYQHQQKVFAGQDRGW